MASEKIRKTSENHMEALEVRMKPFKKYVCVVFS